MLAPHCTDQDFSKSLTVDHPYNYAGKMAPLVYLFSFAQFPDVYEIMVMSLEPGFCSIYLFLTLWKWENSKVEKKTYCIWPMANSSNRLSTGCYNMQTCKVRVSLMFSYFWIRTSFSSSFTSLYVTWMNHKRHVWWFQINLKELLSKEERWQKMKKTETTKVPNQGHHNLCLVSQPLNHGGVSLLVFLCVLNS